ncbi:MULTISPECIES: sensor histidine kinase [Exiguobacterium]|uniref:sensor histidine kinase n=1 Tax=Exiguobacterium TaxID=33986 RepID=UPI001BEA41DF|nr:MULTISPECIES: ATP-binding protein [Exiguobacterium]MCT4776051.1 ATP-binding protein [Exiguobacterium aquaticum]MCT4788039.1 ATP-binding protein [Exiguobacterium mexicanum]
MTERHFDSNERSADDMIVDTTPTFPFIDQAIDAVCYIDFTTNHFYANDRLQTFFPTLQSSSFPTRLALANHLQTTLHRYGCPADQAAALWESVVAAQHITPFHAGERTLTIGERSMALSLYFIHPRTGVFVVWRDTTAEVRQLEQQHAFLEEFTREVQHPLTLISSYAERLSEHRDLDPSAQDLLHVVRRETERLEHLLTSFLDYHQHTTHGKLTVTTFLLNPILHNLCAHYTTLSPFHDITLSAPKPVVIQADVQSVLQLLHNLIGNAIRHSPEGGGIHLSLTDADETIILSVQDSGLGIPPHSLPRLFDANGLDQAELGLLFCKQIVEAHGWGIHVESIYGEGTTRLVDMHPIDVMNMNNIHDEPDR